MAWWKKVHKSEQISFTEEQTDLLDRVCWAARYIYKDLGPGYSRDIYVNAFAAEIQRMGLLFERDREYPIVYRGIPVGNMKIDIVTESKLMIQILEKEKFTETEKASLASYLRQTDLSMGILVGFIGDSVQIASMSLP